MIYVLSLPVTCFFTEAVRCSCGSFSAGMLEIKTKQCVAGTDYNTAGKSIALMVTILYYTGVGRFFFKWG